MNLADTISPWVELDFVHLKSCLKFNRVNEKKEVDIVVSYEP